MIAVIEFGSFASRPDGSTDTMELGEVSVKGELPDEKIHYTLFINSLRMLPGRLEALSIYKTDETGSPIDVIHELKNRG